MPRRSRLLPLLTLGVLTASMIVAAAPAHSQTDTRRSWI